jgi:hypothetical protein
MKFLIRYSVDYSLLVEAASADEAIEIAANTDEDDFAAVISEFEAEEQADGV